MRLEFEGYSIFTQLLEEAESEVYVNVGRTMSFFFFFFYLRGEEGEDRGDSIWCENSFIVHLDCFRWEGRGVE